MPDLRARETGLKDQIAALDAQAADRDAYLKLAGDLEGFLTRLRGSAAIATVEDRQRVLRAAVQDVLVGPEKLTIRHRIPVREPSSGSGHHETTDTEGDMRESSLLRWGRDRTALRGPGHLPPQPPAFHHPGAQHRAQERQDGLVTDAFLDRSHQLVLRNRGKAVRDVRFNHPSPSLPGLINQDLEGIVRRPLRAEPEAARQEVRLEDRLEHDLHRGLHDPVTDRGDGDFILPLLPWRMGIPVRRVRAPLRSRHAARQC